MDFSTSWLRALDADIRCPSTNYLNCFSWGTCSTGDQLDKSVRTLSPSPWAICPATFLWCWVRWWNFSQSTLRLILTNPLTERRVVGKTTTATKYRRTLKAATHYLYTHLQELARKRFYRLHSRAVRFGWASYDCLTDTWTLAASCGAGAISRPPAHTLQLGCKWKTDFYLID